MTKYIHEFTPQDMGYRPVRKVFIVDPILFLQNEAYAIEGMLVERLALYCRYTIITFLGISRELSSGADRYHPCPRIATNRIRGEESIAMRSGTTPLTISSKRGCTLEDGTYAYGRYCTPGQAPDHAVPDQFPPAKIRFESCGRRSSTCIRRPRPPQ